MRALWDGGKFTAAKLANQFGNSVPTFLRTMRPKESEEEGLTTAAQTGNGIATVHFGLIDARTRFEIKPGFRYLILCASDIPDRFMIAASRPRTRPGSTPDPRTQSKDTFRDIHQPADPFKCDPGLAVLLCPRGLADAGVDLGELAVGFHGAGGRAVGFPCARRRWPPVCG